MQLLGALLFFGIGITLGSMGSGGSILALPVLVYILGVSPASAVPMSMVVVGTASLVATFLKWRQGDVHWRALIYLAATGVPGAFVGSAWTHRVPPLVLMTFFASILLIVGFLMLNGHETRLQRQHCRISRCLLAGGFVGLLTGLLGVGGGFLLVPALMLFAGLDLRQASGTSVGIITVNAAAGVLGHLRFARIDGWLTGLLLSSTVVGVALGVSVATRVPSHQLRRILAVVMIAIGIWIAGVNFL